MSKIDLAKNLYAANVTLSRKEMIALFVAELGLSPAAASTYQNTCKNAFGKTVAAVVQQEINKEVVQSVAVTEIRQKAKAVETGDRFAQVDSSLKDSIAAQDDAERAYWAEYFKNAAK